MKLNWIDKLGDWNPQLLREIKGRFRPRNLIISIVISLLGQFFLFRIFQAQLPSASQGLSMPTQHQFCTGDRWESYYLPGCLTDASGNLLINWQLWWLHVFFWLSMFGVFALILAGTYTLISDLANEERRDTLNFIRLSPQSAKSILIGKLLGVPSLLYIVAGLAIPLHLIAGIGAHVPLSLILSFYGLVIASCAFFFSVALLFGLVSAWLGGFQACLGSVAAFIFLFVATFKPITHTPSDWLNLFSPLLIFDRLVKATGLDYHDLSLRSTADLELFYLPVGSAIWAMIGLVVFNFGVGTFWIWQALQRRFPNPTKTIFSKSQSYLMVASLEAILVAFAATSPKFRYSTNLGYNFQELLVYNLILFLSLIVTLTPQRQALQDWARYRRERVSNRKRFLSSSLVKDLIWGEKSPAMAAIALNLAIVATSLTLWIVFVLQPIDKQPAFLSMVIGGNLLLICAAIAQLLTFMRAQKQALWISGALGAVILLPTAILTVLSIAPEQIPGLWLFTPFAWFALEKASNTAIFLSLLGQWSIFTLCTIRMTRQLQRAGESTTKALMSDRSSLPVG
jgi:hypothetical protein